MNNQFVLHKRMPTDLRNTIKDCLCNLFYRKQDLIRHFQNMNCTGSDFRGISIQNTKSANIDLLLSNLEGRTDGGILQKKNLIESIITWNDFESYWFTNGSLSAESAKKSIENLKRILGKKTDQELAKEEIIERRNKEEQARKNNLRLDDLNKKFKELCQMQESSQQRGYALENLLVNIFEYFEIEVEGPFKLTGEQIDGSFSFQGDNYIFEAKCQDEQSANNELYVFAYKIESNTLYPRGVFLSINGYSVEAIERITHNKKPQLVLLDASDLILVLEKRIDLKKLLQKKVKYAQTRGDIYVNAYKILEDGV